MSLARPVRVRFAPSPTGYLHVGGARTALFNWLFARRHGGAFILRIEDTDPGRSRAELIDPILEGFRWLGIDWDEGPDIGGPHAPYLQSARGDIYRDAAQRLVAAERAYPCYCTVEELAAMRAESQAQGRPFRYPGLCRDLTAEERRRREAEGRRPVLRLRVPEEGETVVEDIIRGRVAFANRELDDFIIVRSDGLPTYHFACTVDDVAMEISHVIRADEHLSNTPKHILIYRALDHEEPQFAHVPMILAPDRSKLSKRHGTVGVHEYRARGFLPEAMVNYLALLGWSPEDQREFMARDEMVELFSLERVQLSPAVYDESRMHWMTAHYLRHLPLDRVVEQAMPFFVAAGLVPAAPDAVDRRRMREVIATVRERAHDLVQLADVASYFFHRPAAYDPAGAVKHFRRPGVADLLERAAERLAALEVWETAAIEACYRQLIEEEGIAGGALIHPTRLAVSGRTVGPGLFDLMATLGRDETIARMRLAASRIRDGAA